jgi:ribosomal protein L11 methyltransferase
MSWKLTLPCTRAEAEALNDDIALLALMEPPPALMTNEPDPARPDAWEVHAYFENKPDAASIALIQSLVPSAAGLDPLLELLPDEDWVTISQKALEPVIAGRFYVHTEANRGEPPEGAKCFRIEASRAFGTGSHETTAGCLAMLDRMKRQGRRFAHVADIGTGTGLLAFAALHLWPRAQATASDIDAVSIDVARENGRVNGVPEGRGRGAATYCVASGTDHPTIRARAPYDLVIANILAGPLIELAPAFAAIADEGGSLILAGLLDWQEEAVLAAHRVHGFRLEQRIGGEWPCLHLVKRHRYGWQRPKRGSGRTSQPPGDFGTW